MKKKIGIFLVVFLLSIIISAGFSYAASSKKTPVTITVKVRTLNNCFTTYSDSYNKSTGRVGYEASSPCFREAMGVDGDNSWIADGSGNGRINHSKLDGGMFAFGYNQKNTKVSPSIKGGYGDYCEKITALNTTQTYSFTFEDNKDVQVVIAAYSKDGKRAGAIAGKINYFVGDNLRSDDEAKAMGANMSGGRGTNWNAADWYRKDTSSPSNDKAYVTGNLAIKQNADSSCVEIVSVDKNKSVKDTTVNIYVGCEPIGVNLGGSQDVSHVTIDSGVYKKEGSNQQNNTTPVVNNNGNADSYNVYTNYKTQYQPFNNWKVVQSYVNKLIDTIELISYAYYGIAFITSILMLIINIVAIAGATNNPVMRTRVFMRFGISILCFALLGASFLLTRLFILTCMSS